MLVPLMEFSGNFSRCAYGGVGVTEGSDDDGGVGWCH